MKFSISVKTNAKQTSITRVSDTELFAEIHAPAQDGKANTALIKALSIFLNVPQKRISIKHGVTNKKKIIEILF